VLGRQEAPVAVVHVERIKCDDPECVAYVDELILEQPGRFELHECVWAQVSLQGWSYRDGLDLCPSHSTSRAGG
jgi:hypothetical protein